MARVGVPSVRGLIRQYEQANYTPEKAIYEMIDNVILRAKNIDILLRMDEQLKGLVISDDVSEGFSGILQEGTANPFNFTHIREGQDDDAETSQFGVGLKAGAISLASRLTIVTKVQEKAYKIVFDFKKMSEMDSFEPLISDISLEEYKKSHLYPTGSTLMFTHIRKGIYEGIDPLNSLKSSIQETYEQLLQDTDTTITIHCGESAITIQARPCIYTHPLCAPFTTTWTIYKKEVYFIRNGKDYEVYDKGLLKKKDRASLDSLLEGATECGTIQTTMTKFYHEKEGGEIPYNSIHLYRNKRCYGKWDHTYKTRNGAKNYVQSRIDIRSKELAKLLGLTFNKSISDDIVNTETRAFKEFIKHVTKGFNTDSSVSSYAKLEKVAVDAGIITFKDIPQVKEPMTPVKYLRGDVPDRARLSMAEYIEKHPEISKEKEFKTLFNRMIQYGWIPSPD